MEITTQRVDVRITEVMQLLPGGGRRGEATQTVTLVGSTHHPVVRGRGKLKGVQTGVRLVLERRRSWTDAEVQPWGGWRVTGGGLSGHNVRQDGSVGADWGDRLWSARLDADQPWLAWARDLLEVAAQNRPDGLPEPFLLDAGAVQLD